jgi:predicted alpha/beta superfamily hydrolase
MPEHTLTGNIQEHRGFRSKILGNRRDVLVYLPPDYRRLSRKRYPVLYLQDGQNVFDAATSFAGVEWSVDESAHHLIRKKLMEPVIIVAIANVGEDRIHEYAPTPAVIDADAKRKKRSRGLARDYGRFLVEELKYYIDRKYRTKREAEFTGLGGSSLGGLLTLSLGLWFPNVFTRLIVMSPSVWWDDQVIVKMVEALYEKLPLKIWIDTGTNEPGARPHLAQCFDRKGLETLRRPSIHGNRRRRSQRSRLGGTCRSSAALLVSAPAQVVIIAAVCRKPDKRARSRRRNPNLFGN